MNKLVLLPLAVLLSGCIGAVSNPPLVRPGAPVGAIEVRNDASLPITDFRAGRCGDTLGWGPDYGHDRLDGQSIPVNGSRRFPASPGCYNVVATTSRGGFFSSGEQHFGQVTVPDGEDPVGVWVVR